MISNTKSGPIWPTLYRNVHYAKRDFNIEITDMFWSNLEDYFKTIPGFKKITSWGTGHHDVYETSNGGLLPFGKRATRYPLYNWEMQFQVTTKEYSHTLLYLLCSLNAFKNGYMFHCGWQYPHCEKVSSKKLQICSVFTYQALARTLYNNVEIPNFVNKFVANNWRG